MSEENLAEPNGATGSVPNAHRVGDATKLDTFCQQMDTKTLSGLLAKAQASLLARTEELRHALDASDPEKVYEIAHTIKGSSSSLFAIRVSELAAEIEEMSSDIDAVSKLMPEFESAAKDAVEWWRSKSN